MNIKGKDYICALLTPFLLYGIIATIVFSLLNLNSYFIVGLTACWLITGKPGDKWLLLKHDIFFFACLFYFVSQAISVLFAGDLITAWKHLEMKVGFVVLPLVFCSSRFVNKELLQKLLLAFSILLTVAALVCVLIAWYKFMLHRSTDVFFYHDLVQPINQHAVYFSAFTFMAIVFLTSDGRKVPFLKKRPALLTTWILFEIGVSVLLSSKLILSILGCYLIYLAFKYQSAKYKKAYATVLAAVVVFIAVSVTITDNPVKKRFTDVFDGNIEIIQSKQFNAGVYFTGLQFRLLLWRITYEILNEHHAWWTGVGAANSKGLIRDKYQQLGMYTGKNGGRNRGYLAYDDCHNQFLQSLLDSGVIGLAVFIAWCVAFAFRTLQRKRLIMLWLFITVFLFFFSESVLERQYGIILAIFFPLLFFYTSNNGNIFQPQAQPSTLQ